MKVRKVLRKGKSLNFAGKVYTFSATRIATNIMLKPLSHTIVLILSLAIVFSCRPPAGEISGNLADSVKAEFRHAWTGYKKYAWGHDALLPLSKRPYDWYGSSLLMTPVDAFDTMVLMGLTREAGEAKKLIFDSLSFDRNIEVQAFEIIIRVLAGLLSAYEMDGDRRFLALAEDLGKRLLPIYNSSTGMPYRYVHFQTGRIRDSINNPAVIGTALLEFGTLSKLTGNPVFFDKAKLALIQVFNHRSRIGLVGTWINVETGEWKNKSSHIGGAIDSYYEYLLKAWLLFGDKDCRAMWEESIRAINKFIAELRTNEIILLEREYSHIILSIDPFSGRRFATCRKASGILFRDVAVARHRAGTIELCDDDCNLKTILLATGDYRVCVLFAPPHRRS
ncbi:MAG: Glycoside hydrolase family 47 [Bacteroidetes bacterium]|nr:Glycoside hydrolase family 47 [Bacteroidota bacterium]